MLKERSSRRRGERSFTLLETMIAMTIMVTVILHVSMAQGNMVYNADYGRRMTEAMWLARAVMAKVDYFWGYQEFKKLESEGGVSRGTKFKDMDLPEDSDYTYSLRIEEWKFPILDLLQNGGLQAEKDESSPQESAFPIKDILKQILGDDILKVAHVEVSWPEGAKEQSVSLSYLLTNQRKIDDHLRGLESTYKNMMKEIEREGKKQPTNTKECREQQGPNAYYDSKSKTCKKRNSRAPPATQEDN